jgi:FkbM family methyltransferase
MKRRGGLGFLPFGSAETAETEFLRRLDLSGAVVYDIGAFEGILTMFFSRRARQVVAYEPNPASRERLLTNLRLNHLSNVTVRDKGIGDRSHEISLLYDPLMPGAASGADLVALQIRDGAPITVRTNIQVVRLDDDIRLNQLPVPDILKIDIEGMELAALRGAEETLLQHHPALYIEMHGADYADKRRNAREVLSFLSDHAYGDILHVETSSRLTSDSAEPPGHLFCQHVPTERRP